METDLSENQTEQIYTLINVVGLTVAIVAAWLIYSHIVKEWNTDRFHVQSKNIYRAILKPDYAPTWEAWTCGPLGPYTKAGLPGIADFVRVYQNSYYDLKPLDSQSYISGENIILTDKQFFDIFSFPLEIGNNEMPWGEDWMIISRKAAHRFFGNENPVGKIFRVKLSNDDKDLGKDFRVVGVMRDFPAASTLQADYVLDFTYLAKDRFQYWGMHGLYTYFLLEENSDIPAIEAGIPQLIEKNYPYLKASEMQYCLQPLEDIYFNDSSIGYDFPRGSVRLNIILTGITLLILLLAFANYLIIAMAQLYVRANGIVIQRCLGAGWGRLLGQIFMETGVYVGLALLIATLLLPVLHPAFVRVISPWQCYSLTLGVGDILLFLGIILLFTLGVGGILTGWVFRRLNRCSIRTVLQGAGGKIDVKTILSVIQIGIFMALFFCSVVLMRQMDFVRNRQLGFETREVIHFNWRDWEGHIQGLRPLLASNPDILSLSNGEELPLLGEGGRNMRISGQPDRSFKAWQIHGDADYLRTYRIPLVAGRNIDRESYPAKAKDFSIYRPDNIPEILINQEFARQIGTGEQVLGTLVRGEKEEGWYRVVGIVQDFHFLPLYQSIKPVFILYDIPSVSSSMLVSYRPGKRQSVLAYLRKIYETRFPNSDFQSTEYNFSRLYERDMALVKLIHIFTFMALLIGGMGIFAFSMFIAEKSRREVALRKVGGASTAQILLLLNMRFIWKIWIAALVGLPIAYYGMSQWLMGFAYRIELSVWMYAGVILVSLLLVILIISWQVKKAAHVNPVEVLKGE